MSSRRLIDMVAVCLPVFYRFDLNHANFTLRREVDFSEICYDRLNPYGPRNAQAEVW